MEAKQLQMEIFGEGEAGSGEESMQGLTLCWFLMGTVWPEFSVLVLMEVNFILY